MKKYTAKYYLIPATICLAGIVAIGYNYFFSAFASQDNKQYVYIDEDDTADSVYAKLEPLASHSALTGFRTLARHYDYDGHIRSGRYAIEPGMNTVSVFRMMRNGRQEPVMLTIPECRTMEQMAARLSKKLMLDSTSIAQALTDEDFCEQLGYDTCTIASIFVPNTYEVYWNTSMDKLMQRMMSVCSCTARVRTASASLPSRRSITPTITPRKTICSVFPSKKGRIGLPGRM